MRARLRYTLSQEAFGDLAGIQDYFLEKAGEAVSERMMARFEEAFWTIGRHPGIGHKREDLAGPRPLRFWSVDEYLIIYRTDRDPLEIVMVIHGRRDVASAVESRQP